jgi:hypothetical protein
MINETPNIVVELDDSSSRGDDEQISKEVPPPSSSILDEGSPSQAYNSVFARKSPYIEEVQPMIITNEGEDEDDECQPLLMTPKCELINIDSDGNNDNHEQDEGLYHSIFGALDQQQKAQETDDDDGSFCTIFFNSIIGLLQV